MTIDRIDPPLVAPEREMLDNWLEYHRLTLLQKCEGLTDDQLRTQSVEPSNMSLLGLVRHMTEVERNWFRRVLEQQDAAPLYYDDEDEDGDFTRIADADVAANMATFNEACDESRGIAARHDLDDTGIRRGGPVSLRWIMVHMIEEYARHNGHADFLRERIDGATGD